MTTIHKIEIEEYCNYCNIEVTFIKELYASGLIELEIQETQQLIDFDQIPSIEKYTRMHYDLSINMEGLEVIHNLLQKMNEMQHEIQQLKNRG